MGVWSYMHDQNPNQNNRHKERKHEMITEVEIFEW
jgi:hypothetical protein